MHHCDNLVFDMIPDAKSRCWVEIDLGALERNLRNIRDALPRWIRYVAVVKADAYGHGMAQTVTRLMHAGADLFAVANLREAAEIRELGGGWPILVLSALLPSEDDLILDYNIIPTVSSAAEVERFAMAARRAKRPIKIHLKIDTGMGRLGVWHEEAPSLVRQIMATPELSLEGVFTHFSSADVDAEFTALQRETFLATLAACEGLPLGKLLIHADNSAGIDSLGQDSPFNAVRVGLLQFGVRPYPGSLLGQIRVEPVLSFHTRVGLIKELPTGTPISYNRTHYIARATRTGVLTAGYADGIPTSLSNRADVVVNGYRCPILGRVTMDQVIVDLTDVPQVSVGDKATFIGSQQTSDGVRATIGVEEFSERAGQIPWEVFVSITKRVQRIYRIDSGV